MLSGRGRRLCLHAAERLDPIQLLTDTTGCVETSSSIRESETLHSLFGDRAVHMAAADTIH